MYSGVTHYWFVRHPQLEKPTEPTCIGQTNAALAADAEEKTRDFIKTVAKWQPERIVCSDLIACSVPGRQIASSLKIPLASSVEWREISFGKWENLPWRLIESSYPDDLSKWMKDFVKTTPPEGESFKLFYDRVERAFQNLKTSTSKRTLVVTHDGVLRALFCMVTRLPLENAFSVKFDHLSFIHVEDGKNVRIQFDAPQA